MTALVTCVNLAKLGVLLQLATAPLAFEASAQFTPGLLANDSYWSDGKAEWDLYEAELMRAGQPRKCELVTILRRQPTDPKTLARVDDPKRNDAVKTILFNELWTTGIGMLVEQASLTALWRPDGLLARLQLVGYDGFGNVLKTVQTNPGSSTLVSDTYREGVSTNTLPMPAQAIFYDELPLRVRTIDWSAGPHEFEIQLAPSLGAPGKLEWKPARVSWRPVERRIEVTVRDVGGSDRFLLDQRFPFLLRDWQMRDGSRWKMKRDLKADYWNYNKNGDRERAFNNPMLQHPD